MSVVVILFYCGALQALLTALFLLLEFAFSDAESLRILSMSGKQFLFAFCSGLINVVGLSFLTIAY